MFTHSKAVGFAIICAISLCSSEICLPICTDTNGDKTDGPSRVKCSFDVIFNPFPSVTGYYTIAECGDASAPTIGVYQNIVTEFKQHDKSNWYHPLGFGYNPGNNDSNYMNMNSNIT
jgi:hypothetical protein